MLTGESIPVSKGVGDRIVGGSINGDGSVKFTVEKVGDDTFLAHVIAMVSEAQASRSQTQNLADRAAFWLTIISVTVGIITFAVWFSILNDFTFSLERMVTVMVITCPHALGLAIPLVVAVSTSLAAGAGLLIRNRNAFEKARNINAVVFDKTGTLTRGDFIVQSVIELGDWDKDKILRMAAAVESESEHPIARGIVREAGRLGLDIGHVEGFNAIKGKGAQGRVSGTDILVASPNFIEEKSIRISDDNIRIENSLGRTVVFVLADGKLKGAISLGDTVRDESLEAVKKLKRMGIKCIMLTGDNRMVAEAVSKTLGLDEFYAEVLPGNKADMIKQLKNTGLVVAMTGDGINDAPALATADLGIAIGAGTDVAVETADVVLVRSDPRDVVSIIKLSRATYTKMVQNLIYATAYNIFAIPLAAGVLAGVGIVLNPAVGAIFMSVSTVVVAINARFLRID